MPEVVDAFLSGQGLRNFGGTRHRCGHADASPVPRLRLRASETQEIRGYA